MTDKKTVHAIDEKVVNYLASITMEETNRVEVLMNIKEGLFEDTDACKNIRHCIEATNEVIASLDSEDPIVRSVNEANIDKQMEKLDDYYKELEKAKNSFCDTSLSEVTQYFTREAFARANYIRINRDLSKVNESKTIYNLDVINASLDTIKECYGLDEFSCEVILKFMSQVRLRAKMLYKDGICDIRNYHQPEDFGIMPAFYGEQGCGKSAFAEVLGEVMTNGSCSAHGPDEIMGSFGTLDVFSKPVILLNEYGKQNKDGTDELKKYINGEVVTVNQKYKDPVTENCFASFILTSNFDPIALNGQETGSRRICICYFTHNPTRTKQEIREAVEALWNCVDEHTFEKVYGISAEDLCRVNLKQQQDETVEEWLSGLDYETIEFLKEPYHSVSKIQNFFEGTKRMTVFKNRLKAILGNKGYFTETIYGKNKYYQLNQDYEVQNS